MPFSVDIKHVQRAEETLGRKLSLSYVAQMCRSNGGEIDTDDDNWNLYPILDDSDRQPLKRTCNDIVRETNLARQWQNFPSGALAIGSNGSGDQLVMLADPSSNCFSDTIYWWDHETGELNHVADDFSELSNGA
jgi:hypothetical protein